MTRFLQKKIGDIFFGQSATSIWWLLKAENCTKVWIQNDNNCIFQNLVVPGGDRKMRFCHAAVNPSLQFSSRYIGFGPDFASLKKIKLLVKFSFHSITLRSSHVTVKSISSHFLRSNTRNLSVFSINLELESISNSLWSYRAI